MSAVSDAAIRTALYSKINGASSVTSLLSSATAIYDSEAPAAAVYPFVSFSLSTGTPEYTFASRAFDNDLWLIKAMDRSTSGTVADNIAQALRALLTDATLTITGAVLMSVRPEQRVRTTEVVDGQKFFHAGNLYRLTYQ
jgi:hypothetical protein